jgi:C1A family cysteine protease
MSDKIIKILLACVKSASDNEFDIKKLKKEIEKKSKEFIIQEGQIIKEDIKKEIEKKAKEFTIHEGQNIKEDIKKEGVEFIKKEGDKIMRDLVNYGEDMLENYAVSSERVMSVVNNKFELNCLPSPHDSRDYTVGDVLDKQNKLPETFNLLDKMPGIRDQGFQGSCVAQTLAAIKEYHENVDVHFTNHMSPQFIYNLRPNRPASGMYLRDAFEILRNTGVCPEKDYPYNVNLGPESITEEIKATASNYKISSYAKVNTITELKQSLMQYGPCAIVFAVYNQLNPRFWEKSNVIALSGYHCLTVVGWDKKGFILKNSWGVYWGYGGYTYYPYEQFGTHVELWCATDSKSKVVAKDNDKTASCYGCCN